jgi:hypothetical protein
MRGDCYGARRMRLGRLEAVVLFVFFSACDPQAALDKAGFVRLTAYAGTVQLQVNPDTACPTFPKVTATQNGTALTQVEAGGTLGVQSGHECKSPEWVMLDVPQSEAKDDVRVQRQHVVGGRGVHEAHR